MTVEGRPQSEWDKMFYNQRRDRLADSVADYLTCESTSARQCYEEMLAEVDGWIKHHREGMNKAQALKNLLMGYRDVNIDFPHSPGDVTNKQFIQENNIPERY